MHAIAKWNIFSRNRGKYVQILTIQRAAKMIIDEPDPHPHSSAPQGCWLSSSPDILEKKPLRAHKLRVERADKYARAMGCAALLGHDAGEAIVITVPYVISWYMGPRHNGTRLICFYIVIWNFTKSLKTSNIHVFPTFIHEHMNIINFNGRSQHMHGFWTDCGLVTPYGDIKVDQHAFSECERKQSGGNKPLPEAMLAYHKWFINIHVTAISQEILKPPITEIEGELLTIRKRPKYPPMQYSYINKLMCSVFCTPPEEAADPAMAVDIFSNLIDILCLDGFLALTIVDRLGDKLFGWSRCLYTKWNKNPHRIGSGWWNSLFMTK